MDCTQRQALSAHPIGWEIMRVYAPCMGSAHLLQGK